MRLQQCPGQVQAWVTVYVLTFPAPLCPLPWHPSLFWFPFMCIYRTVCFWLLAYLKIEAIVYWTFATLHEHWGRNFHASLRHCHSTTEKWERLSFPLYNWEKWRLKRWCNLLVTQSVTSVEAGGRAHCERLNSFCMHQDHCKKTQACLSLCYPEKLRVA